MELWNDPKINVSFQFEYVFSLKWIWKDLIARYSVILYPFVWKLNDAWHAWKHWTFVLDKYKWLVMKTQRKYKIQITKHYYRLQTYVDYIKCKCIHLWFETYFVAKLGWQFFLLFIFIINIIITVLLFACRADPDCLTHFHQ